MSKLKRGLTKDMEKELEEQAIQKEELFQPVIRIYQETHYLADDQIDTIANILQVIDFFKENCPETSSLQEFTKLCCQNLVYEVIHKDQAVFHVDDTGDKFYIVLSGRAGIFIRRQQPQIESDDDALKLKWIKIFEKLRIDSQKQIPQDELQKLYGQLIRKQNKPSKTIEQELMLFKSGNFDKYFTEWGTCKFMFIAQKIPGQIFGEMALTNDKPRTATIFALSELKLLSLTKINFKQVGEKGMKALQQKIEYFLKLFPQMTKHKMSKLILYFTSAKFPANFFVWKQGDETDGFILLKDGEMQLLQNREMPKPPTKNNVDFNMMTLFSKKPQPKDQKETIILTNVTNGCFVGESEVVQKIDKRLFSVKTISVCNCYCLSLENYIIVKRTFPEFNSALNQLQLRNSNLFKKRVEDLVKTKISGFYLQKQEEVLNIERRYVDEFDKSKPIYAISQPILRSNLQSKLSKHQIIEQNQSIATLHTKLEEQQYGGQIEEFNMLKLANENFQKCLFIRVEKQFEQFKPSKPKAKTPYFSKQPNNMKELLQSVKRSQIPSFTTRDQISFRHSIEQSDDQTLPQICKQHTRVVNPSVSQKADIIKSGYQTFMKSKSLSSRFDRTSEHNKMQGFMLTDSIATYHPLHSHQNIKEKQRMKTSQRSDQDVLKN